MGSSSSAAAVASAFFVRPFGCGRFPRGEPDGPRSPAAAFGRARGGAPRPAFLPRGGANFPRGGAPRPVGPRAPGFLPRGGARFPRGGATRPAGPRAPGFLPRGGARFPRGGATRTERFFGGGPRAGFATFDGAAPGGTSAFESATPFSSSPPFVVVAAAAATSVSSTGATASPEVSTLAATVVAAASVVAELDEGSVLGASSAALTETSVVGVSSSVGATKVREARSAAERGRARFVIDPGGAFFFACDAGPFALFPAGRPRGGAPRPFRAGGFPRARAFPRGGLPRGGPRAIWSTQALPRLGETMLQCCN